MLTTFFRFCHLSSPDLFMGHPKVKNDDNFFVGISYFLVNRRFIYRHEGGVGIIGYLNLLEQVAGYLPNLVLLLMFYEWLEFPHQIVHAIAIAVMTIYLFFALRVFVFLPCLSWPGVVR